MLTKIFKEVSNWGGFWAIKKQNGAWVKPSYKDMPIDYPNHFPNNVIEKAKDHLNDIVIT